MKRISIKLVTAAAILVCSAAILPSQTVPQGIHYQAVARDNTGKELSDRNIDVRFSIISGTPLGSVVYQELHQGVRTSKYGVFTLVVGGGLPVGGTVGELSQVSWSTAPHYLRVEIRFTNEFADMGTMQFLAVPYALYAAKSLEAGPAGPEGPIGPQGPPGDPASDKQTLSFNGTTLTISGNPGNWVDLSALVNDADADPKNEIQDLEIIGQHTLRITGNSDANPIDLARYDQRLLWNPVSRRLVITNSTDTIDLSRVLSFTPADRKLTISGGNTIDLSPLVDDADADPANELITSFSLEGSKLVIKEGANEKSVDFSSNMMAFRARKTTSTPAPINEYTALSQFSPEYAVGSGFNPSTGVFTAPVTGIYTFNISYFADGTGSGRNLTLFLNSEPYENIALEISSYSTVTVRSVTMRLTEGDMVNLSIHTGTATQTGTATFSGFRVY